MVLILAVSLVSVIYRSVGASEAINAAVVVVDFVKARAYDFVIAFGLEIAVESEGCGDGSTNHMTYRMAELSANIHLQ